MASPEIIVRYIADTKAITAATGQVGAQGSKTGALVKKGMLPAAAALGLLAVGSKKAIDAASSLNEQISASEKIFGSSATAVQDWAGTLAESAGLSASEGLAAANAYGNMLTTLGTAPEKAAGMSQSLVQLAGDMASFNDQDPTVMLDALRSGLSGEAEPLKRFGVAISEARVQAFAYENGIAKVGKELTEQQKIQARYGLIMQDTAKQQGDFVDTADSVANAQRTNAAAAENAGAAFGQALLPVMEKLQGVATPLLQFLGKYPAVLYALAAVILVAAAAVMVLNVAAAAGVAITLPITGIILAIIAAIALLVVAGVLLYKNWDKIVAVAGKVWGKIKSAAKAVIDWLRNNWDLILPILFGPFGLAVIVIRRNWDKIKQVVMAAKDAVVKIFNALKDRVASIVSGISSVLGRLQEIFRKPIGWAKSAVDAVKSAFSSLVDWLQGLPGKIRNAISGAADALKGPLNAVINAWNGLRIPGFNIHVSGPGPMPDIDFGWGGADLPNIPTLAAGGIVTRPTLALVGEAGPEAVVPLDRGHIGPTVNLGGVVIREELDIDRLAAKLSAAVAVRR